MNPLCSKCGRPGVKALGIDTLCADCLVRLFDGRRGVGVVHGGAAPEVGPDFFSLKCNACGATWCGPIGEWCQYCAHRGRFGGDDEELRAAHYVLRQMERDLLLTVPSFDDPRPRDVVLLEWGLRLKRATESGLITRNEAREIWQEAVRHAAA